MEQSGEIADGVLPIYWPSGRYGKLRQMLDAGSVAAGRPAGSVAIAPYITTAVVVDEEQRAAARLKARQPVAFYVGRMGRFYAEMLARYGYAAEVAAVQEGWKPGVPPAPR